MGRIVVTEFVSLDGVIEAPGGEEGYEHSGWAFETNRGDEGDRFKMEETAGSAALLLGRRTYEGFAEAWPKRTGEFADKFNTMPKYVVSRSMDSADWNNTTILRDVAADVPPIVKDIDGDIVVHGSAQLVQSLFATGLVDELRMMVFPVVLGHGKRLFGTSGKIPMRLADSKVVGDGIAILVYRREP